MVVNLLRLSATTFCPRKRLFQGQKLMYNERRRVGRNYFLKTAETFYFLMSIRVIHLTRILVVQSCTHRYTPSSKPNLYSKIHYKSLPNYFLMLTKMMKVIF